jgi:antibiotic biosynthesis monooxygenase (ABM) superfamily enzyme
MRILWCTAHPPAGAAQKADAVEGSANAYGPLTVIVTWRVRKGREREFEAWRHEIADAALAFPGHMEVNVIRTSAGGQEYVVVFRFDTYEHLRTWQESDVRRKLLKRAEPFREKEPSYRMQSGLEFWFAPPDTASPPRWKMALVTVVGVWPASMLVPWLLNPLINKLPSVLQALLVAVGIVILLTWVIMPVLVNILKRWL